MILSLFRQALSNRYALIATATILTITSSPLVANSAPVKLKSNFDVTFDFKGCISKENDIVCQGIFLSGNGEQSILISGGLSASPYIADSDGKTYFVDKILVGSSTQCIGSGKYCSTNLVEGIKYRTTFVFNNVLLPSNNIPLFESNTLNLKIRNISLGELNNQDSTTNNSLDQERHRSLISAYRINNGNAIVSGLTPKQMYQIQGNLKNGTQGTARATPDACGEIKINRINDINSLVINRETIDMKNLPSKSYKGCRK